MASAIPTDYGIAGEQLRRSGEFFTFTVGAAFAAAEPASIGGEERETGSRSRGRSHRRPAGGDGRPR